MSGEYLKIENIGRIKDAYIKLDGLNIITGKNDTGKSTVGKVIFSIVKAISRYKEDFQNNKEQEVFALIEKLYFRFRRSRNSNNEFEKTRQFFYPPRFMDEIKPFIEENRISEEINNILNSKRKHIKEIIEKEKQNEYLLIIDQINDLLIQEDNKEKQIISALNKAFVSEFHSELSPQTAKIKESKISYHSISKIFEAIIEKNDIKKLLLEEDLLFKDVTYIESPIYLQLSNVIDNADTLFDFNIEEERRLIRHRPKISLHIKDLINKLEQSKYFTETLFDINIDLLMEITKIMEGTFIYDEKKSEFKFKKKGKSVLKAINTASGIKAFGIIQLLIQANTLDERSLLIIDEPENHLHPEWQVKYADVITELVKNNISIIINSHSPYMIQALNHFAQKKGLSDITKYYLTEPVEKSKLITFKDVSDDIDSVFRTLAEPINKIMW